MIGGADPPGVRAAWSPRAVTGQRGSARWPRRDPVSGGRAGCCGCLAGRGDALTRPGGVVLSKSSRGQRSVLPDIPSLWILSATETDYAYAIEVALCQAVCKLLIQVHHRYMHTVGLTRAAAVTAARFQSACFQSACFREEEHMSFVTTKPRCWRGRTETCRESGGRRRRC